MENVKARNRKMIIQATSKIALKKGFYVTSLEEIAQASGLTKRTILNLFETKTNLIFETICDVQMEYFAYMDRFISSEQFQKKSGLEQVLSILIERAKYYDKEPWRSKNIQEAEHLVPQTEREKKNCEKYYRKCERIKNYYYEPIRKGKLDRSIRSSAEEEAIANFLFISFGAISQRLSELSVNENITWPVDFKEIMRDTLQMIKIYLSSDLS